VNGVKFQPGSVDVERTLTGGAAGEPDAEIDPKSLSVPARSSASASASAAQAAVIAAACGT